MFFESLEMSKEASRTRKYIRKLLAEGKEIPEELMSDGFRVKSGIATAKASPTGKITRELAEAATAGNPEKTLAYLRKYNVDGRPLSLSDLKKLEDNDGALSSVAYRLRQAAENKIRESNRQGNTADELREYIERQRVEANAIKGRSDLSSNIKKKLTDDIYKEMRELGDVQLVAKQMEGRVPGEIIDNLLSGTPQQKAMAQNYNTGILGFQRHQQVRGQKKVKAGSEADRSARRSASDTRRALLKQKAERVKEQRAPFRRAEELRAQAAEINAAAKQRHEEAMKKLRSAADQVKNPSTRAAPRVQVSPAATQFRQSVRNPAKSSRMSSPTVSAPKGKAQQSGLTGGQAAAIGLGVPAAGFLGYQAMKPQEKKTASWRYDKKDEVNKASFIHFLSNH